MLPVVPHGTPAQAGTRPADLLLAQTGFGIIDPPAPAPLPRPPLPERYALENPWPLAIVLALAGAIALVRLRASGRARAGAWTAAGLIGAAVLIWLLASTVQTGREAITAQTADLVAAAARADVAALDALLSDQLSLFRPGRGAALDKAQTLERVRRDLGGFYRVRQWAILETQAHTDSSRSGVTQCRVRVTLEASGLPNISWWRIEWRRADAGPWRAVTIEPVSVTPEVRSQLK